MKNKKSKITDYANIGINLSSFIICPWKNREKERKMRLKSVDKIFGKYSLCFSVKSTDEVNFSGWIKNGTSKMKITPIHNSNMS